MAKNKSEAKGSKPGQSNAMKNLTSIKGGSVTKPSQAPKAKAQEVGKKAAAQVEKAKSKLKELVKEPSESEETDSDASSEESDEDVGGKKPADTSDSSESSDQDESDSDSSGSESEVKPQKAAVNGKAGSKINGVNGTSTPVASTKKVKEPGSSPSTATNSTDSDAESSDGSGSESESGSSSSSEEDSEDEPVNGKVDDKPEPKAAPQNATSKPEVKAAVQEDEGSESDDSESGSDEDSEDDSGDDAAKTKPKAKATNGKVTNGAAKKDQKVDNKGSSEEDTDDSDGSEEDSEDSSGSSDESESEEEEAPQPKKRKAVADPEPAPKKAKVQTDDGVKAAPVKESNESNESKTLWVGNLSYNVDEEWLGREFGSYGQVTSVRIPTDRQTGRKKGNGYIDFASVEDAKTAFTMMTDKEIDGRQLRLDFAQSRTNDFGGRPAQDRAKSFGDRVGDPTDTIWVGNLAFSANEDIVRDAFSSFGTLLGVRLPTDPNTGDFRGFGYVQFSSVDEAKVALENLNGTPIGGRNVRLDYSGGRAGGGDGSSRGGRGGRGGGRGDFGGGRGDFGGGRGGRGDFRGRGGRGGDFGGRGGGRGFGGGRGGGRGGRGGAPTSTNRGGFGDFTGTKKTF